MMKFRFDAYDPATGDFLRTMPAPVKAQIGDVFGGRGTLALSYAGAPEIPTFLEIRASVYFGGEWAPVGPSYLRLGGSHADTDPSGLREVSFVSREWILGKARVGEGELELIDGKRPFYQASPGAIMRTLLLEAQDRGAARGIELGDFTATADTDGTAWSKVATIYYSPGLPIGDVLSNLVEQGMCDYRMVGNRLELFEPETALGRDLTTGGNPVRLRGAVSDAPVTYTLEDLTTSALLIGEDGFQVEVDNPSAPDDYGRMEVTIEQGGVSSEGTARTMIDAELQRGSREIRQITRTQHSSGAPFLPYRDYRVGDFVQALDQGQWQRYRVREIQLVMDGTGWTVHTVLNDRLEELLLRLANRTNGIVNGSKGSGGDGTRPAPPPAPGIEPAAPEGLILDQQVYLDGNGDARGVVTAGWGAVTESTRGHRIDIGGYELWRRDNETYAPWRQVARTDGPLEATDSPVWLTRGDGSAAEYQWRVRAIAEASGRTGLWSLPVTLTMTQDTTPPPPPSLPVVETGFRIVTASWDGLTEDGTEMPIDFSRVRVYLAATESMTDAELVGSLQYPGAWNSETMPAGVPVWVAFSAVDRVGNESAMTPAVSVTPQALVDEESIAAEVGRIDGVIEGAVDALQDEIDNIVVDAQGTTTYQTPTEPDASTDPPPKAGDIWFDTSDNMKLYRHDGSAWVSAADERIQTIEDAQEQFGQDITDAEARALAEAQALAEQARVDAEGNAATDAQEKANAARDAAIAEAETKDQQVRSDVDTAIGSARDDLESQINTVRTSVDGKNAITQSVDAPPTSYDGAVGDRWERMSSMGSGGSLISNWRWNGSVWVSTIISDAVLGNVDAGKIVAGEMDGARIKAGTLYADRIVSGVSSNMVSDPGFNNDEITATRIDRATTSGASLRVSNRWFFAEADSPTSGNVSIPLRVTPGDFTPWPASPGMRVVAKAEVSVPTVTTSSAEFRFAIRYTDSSGMHYTAMSSDPAWLPLSSAWQEVVGEFQLPLDVIGFSVDMQFRAGMVGTGRVRAPFVSSPTAGTLIEDGAITTDKILANAITAGKIDAGAINAEHIVAGGIEASSLIVGGSIGETLIQDGAITTRTIRADAVGADAIAAGVIDAGHIIAGGIQADAILVGGSVGSTLIEGGAITTDKIRVGAITAESGIIESLNAGVLTAGTIDAARIGAKTLTGDKLLIGGGTNLLPGADDWATSSAGWEDFGRSAGNAAIWIQGRRSIRSSATFHLQEGEYAFKVDARASVPGTSFYIQLGGEENSPYALSNAVPGTDWTTLEGTVTITVPGYYDVYIYGSHPNGANNDGGYQWFRNMSLRARVGGTLIEDGAITTDKILANAITAGKVATGAITAGKIAANAVEADTIAGGAIDGKIITGATVRTSASGARVQLNANGLYAYNSSGGETFRISAQTGAVYARGNFEQTNSYGSVILGPNLYSSSTTSPGLRFSHFGSSWNGEAGLTLREGAAGLPELLVQGPFNSSGSGSFLALPAGSGADGGSTRLVRNFGSGATSYLSLLADRDALLYSGAGNLYMASRNAANTSSNSRVTLQANGSAFMAAENVYVDTESTDGEVRLRKRNTSGTATGAWFRVYRDGVEMYSSGGNSLRVLNTDTYMNGIIGRVITGPSSNLIIGNGGVIGVEGSSRRWKTEIETVDPASYEDGLLSIDFSSWLSREDVEKAEEYRAWRAENPMCPVLEEYAHVDEDPVRQYGAIAEQVHEAGVDGLVGYDEEGLPATIDRANFGVALVPVVRQLRDRVAKLEAMIGDQDG